MKLHLSLKPDGHTAVICNGQLSHGFDPAALVPKADGPPQPLENPQGYGQRVFVALFSDGSPAGHALEAQPEHIALVVQDEQLDAVAWEYACRPQRVVVRDVPFVRSLPPAQRIPLPPYDGHLHIVAVPSDAPGNDVPPLRIEAEWARLAKVRSVWLADALFKLGSPLLVLLIELLVPRT